MWTVRSLLTGALLLGVVGGAGTEAVAASGSGVPDFALTANYKAPTFTGYIVRGETGRIQPSYPVTDPFGCFFDSNSISAVSLNDFAGSVSLQILGLPQGVTSQTATSVSVPRRGAVSTPLKLQAAATAALGPSTAVVRATSGSVTHSLELQLQVVDELPCTDASLPVTSPSPSTSQTDAVTASGAEYSISSKELRIEAGSSDPRAELKVSVASTGAIIGTLTHVGDGRYRGQFQWPQNPSSVVVRSSLGGSATTAVAAK